MWNSKPSIFRFIAVSMAVYMSSYVLMNITGNLKEGIIAYQIIWLVFCSGIFSVGLIQTAVDLRKVYRMIRRKIKNYFFSE